MQPVKIKINKLGRVRDSELEILPVMIFSGESGLGKSYLAMLSHYIFEVLLDTKRIDGFFKERGFNYAVLSKGFKGKGTALTFNKKDFEKWMSKDAVKYVAYVIQNSNLDADMQFSLPDTIPDIIQIQYQEEVLGLIDHEEVYTVLSTGGISYRVREDDTFGESAFSFIFRFSLINLIFGDFTKLSSSFMFPPSRGPFLAYMQNPEFWTGMYGEFITSLDLLSSVQKYQKEGTALINGLIEDILEGKVFRDGNSIQYVTNGVQMPITAAAASVKEIAIFQWLAKFDKVATSAVLVEEPEAHLHPKKQRMMADILLSLCHLGTYMQITTHSDYFLERVNELLKYGTIFNRTEDPSSLEEIGKKTGIISDMTIDPQILGAYLLEKRSDGSSHAVRQSLGVKSQIPLTSFAESARKGVDNSDTLDEAFEYEESN